MSGVLLEQRAGIKMNHVPYRGSGPMLADLLGGHLLIAFDNLPSSIGGIRGGQIRALAVTTKTRAAVLPDVPTVQESGVADYEVASWFGVYGPAGMPAPIAERLEREILSTVAKPEVQARLRELGTTPLGGSRATLERKTAAEVSMWTAVARASGIEPQ
jgi:tripartite-type tricarboxylate transporter receptor subunit TctC